MGTTTLPCWWCALLFLRTQLTCIFLSRWHFSQPWDVNTSQLWKTWWLPRLGLCSSLRCCLYLLLRLLAEWGVATTDRKSRLCMFTWLLQKSATSHLDTVSARSLYGPHCNDPGVPLLQHQALLTLSSTFVFHRLIDWATGCFPIRMIYHRSFGCWKTLSRDRGFNWQST